MGYQTAEAMVVRKGFSVEQLRECLAEYADLNVVEVRRLLVGLLPSSRPCRLLSLRVGRLVSGRLLLSGHRVCCFAGCGLLLLCPRFRFR